MKKKFNQKLDLNSDQIQRLTKSETKEVVGGLADGLTKSIDWSTFNPNPGSIDWEGTRHY